MEDTSASWLDRIDPAFGHWLAGFSDGESAFVICRVTSRGENWKTWPNCRYQLHLRADDADILRTIQSTLMFGNLNYRNPPKDQPRVNQAAAYIVTRIDDCLRLVELFTRFPLRAKKRAQFDVWANAVHEMAKGRERDDDLIEEYRARLNDLRKYVAPDWLDRLTESNPSSLKHRRDYGTPPPCLCGCGGATKVLSNPKGGIAHPENPNYSCFMRGHYTRRVLARLAADL
jgi:hypothetical protein